MTILALSIALLCSPLLAQAQTTSVRVILGRPTDRSVTANILAARAMEIFVEYGVQSGAYDRKTPRVKLDAASPSVIELESLKPNTHYYYRVRYRQTNQTEYSPGAESSFQTQRPAGAPFTFVVQADPHLDEVSDRDVYMRSLRDELASGADFMIDLGDTFMSDKLESQTPDEVLRRHLLARSYYELVGHSLPIFLVLGNHEGESGRRLDGTANNLAVLAARTRKTYFPNPEPNSFYTGSSKPEPFIGLRQNYYAWTWGDALLVVLDPYWHTTARPGQNGDNWYWTLGREQYDWLKKTLEQNRSKFKFVFAHNLVGGLDLSGRARGGIEGAPYFEWGGHNQDGSWGFAEKRPGWEMPIHHLLVKHNVTAFFHGHDHLYARQELDGVVYQEVPQPSSGRMRNPSGQYAYTHGDILPGSGYMRLRVSSDGVNAEFIRTSAAPPAVAHTYSMKPRPRNTTESPTSVAGSNVAPAPSESAEQLSRKGGKKGGGRSLGKQPLPAQH